jgi:hypothetical protein
MWFNHPKYIIAKNSFLKNSKKYNYERLTYNLPKTMFICGGDERFHHNRAILEKYIKLHYSQYLTFRAEYAWEIISKKTSDHNSTNALDLEEQLADFSDIVIILVESFGTVAELGAFSLNPALRKKLLPILDIRYKDDNSFINTGPVTWINEESKYKPSIFTNFQTILTCFPEIDLRLKKSFQNNIPIDRKIGKYNFSNKTFLFYLLMIISSLGPISLAEIASILEITISYNIKKKIHFFYFHRGCFKYFLKLRFRKCNLILLP